MASPPAAARPAARVQRIGRRLRSAAAGSVIDSTGTSMRRSSGLRDAGVDDRHIPPGPDQEAPDLLERVLRRAEADPLEGRAACRQLAASSARTSASSRSSVSARCAPRLVRATAWISSTITVSTSREHLARLRGEDQVQRLGRRDEDVRRVAHHRRALLLGRVAGADRDRDCSAPMPAQRRAQVALDVVGERLQRADVEHPRARSPARRARLAARVRRSSAHRNAASVLPEPVGRREQHVLSGGDRRPGLALRRGGPPKACASHDSNGGLKTEAGTPRA